MSVAKASKTFIGFLAKQEKRYFHFSPWNHNLLTPASLTSNSVAQHTFPPHDDVARRAEKRNERSSEKGSARANKNDGRATRRAKGLNDRFHRRHKYLRISLTEKCNLRCTYCMPEEGVPTMQKESILRADEIGRLARTFVAQGVNKVRLTGGEPTLRKDLPTIMEHLSALKQDGLERIGITTNGVLLQRQLSTLLASGLTHITVSIDTLDPFKFELMTRRPLAGLEKVLRGIDVALSMGMKTFKVNVVILRGVNDSEDLLSFVRWAKDKAITVRFIEYMPFDGNRWQTQKLVPYTELIQTITSTFGPLERLQDDVNDTSEHFRAPGHLSELGFITSMTDHFCQTCDCIRITADGNIKVCLFGNAELSLRDAMRNINGITDDRFLTLIQSALKQKHAKHGGVANLEELAKAARDNRSMIRIGG